jgi:hypothetical protein
VENLWVGTRTAGASGCGARSSGSPGSAVRRCSMPRHC